MGACSVGLVTRKFAVFRSDRSRATQIVSIVYIMFTISFREGAYRKWARLTRRDLDQLRGPPAAEAGREPEVSRREHSGRGPNGPGW
jgi:hypothetical protein